MDMYWQAVPCLRLGISPSTKCFEEIAMTYERTPRLSVIRVASPISPWLKPVTFHTTELFSKLMIAEGGSEV